MSDNAPRTNARDQLFHIVPILVIVAALAFGAYLIYGGTSCACSDEPFQEINSGLQP
jgi:hypothetical protein